MFLVRMLAAPWLGHGRATECYLVFVSGLYGVLLLIPGAAFDSAATADLAWSGYGHLVALPLLTQAVFAGAGLLGNIRGWPLSRLWRFIGASMGFLIWTWYAAKFTAIGDLATVGLPFCVVAGLFSIRIMGLALAGVPRSGAPGAM